MRFSPFDSSFTELVTSDLTRLQSVSEGWYVEFKREVPSAKAVAKSVAAFANTNGGWLFYGIEESEDGKRVAEKFPGIPVDDYSSLQMRIRDAVAAHVDPTPHFDVRLISGPEGEISLANDRGVIAVRIPQGVDPPYVHSTGRIYRRVADRSDPVRETNRSALDRLRARSAQQRDEFKSFLEDDPHFTDAESTRPFLKVFLLRDRFGQLPAPSSMSFEEFVSIAEDDSPEGGASCFETAHANANGFVARQVGVNDPTVNVFQISHYMDGTTLLLAPFKVHSPMPSIPEFQNYKHGQEFVQLCHSKQIDAPIIDLSIIANLLCVATRKHRLFCDAGDIGTDTLGKVRLLNVLRCIPFLGTEGYWELIQAHGFPVIQQETLMAPPGTSPSSLVDLGDMSVERSSEDEISEADRARLQMIDSTVPLLITTLHAVGLGGLVRPDDAQVTMELYSVMDSAAAVYRSPVGG